MQLFSDLHISLAGLNDISSLTHLLNSAYRGESSKRGWTTEAHLITGETRSDEKDLFEIISMPGSVFLKYTNAEGAITGCVNLQQHGEKIYLGMFSVSPLMQGGGVGKILLTASEEYALHLSATCIYMSVISVRTELINWYQRHGYRDTGERRPFIEDPLSGKHLLPLEFMILEKTLIK